MNPHPVKSDKHGAPERISDTNNGLNWNGDLADPNDSEDNCESDDETDIKHNKGIKRPECTEEQDLSATRYVPRSVRPKRTSTRQDEKVLVTVNVIETRGNQGVNKNRTQCIDGSLASSCSLSNSFSSKYIQGEWWEVPCEYRLIKRCIAGAMNHLARYIISSRVRVNSARRIHRPALPQRRVSIGQKDYQPGLIMLKTIIDRSRCWMDNTSKSVSTICGVVSTVIHLWLARCDL